jgi:hypothetical protein
MEASLLGLGLNVAMKGVSVLQKLFKSDSSIRKALLKEITKKRQGLNKNLQNHTTLLVLPTGCGKTSLMKHLSTQTKDGANIMILDLDSVLSHEFTNMEEKKINDSYLNGLGEAAKFKIYSKTKEFYSKLKEDFPKHRIVLLSSDLGLGKILNIEDVVIVIPSDSLLEQILSNPELSPEKIKLIRHQWIMLASNGNTRFNAYTSFKELETMVKNSFGLTNKLTA